MPDGGNWNVLLDIAAEASDAAAQYRSAPPSACPACGEPLESGSDGSLHCRFDGYQFPRDGWPW